MNVLKISITTAFAALFAVSCAQQASQPGANTANTTKANNAATPAPSASTPVKDELAMAADLYTVNCMTCHKDSGKGGPVTVEGKKLNPDDLTSDKMKGKSDEKLKEYIKDGVVDEGMPSFKDKLTDAQIVSMVRYVRVLQGK